MVSENHQSLVSIITIVYNGEKYLETCLRSIESQTYKNIEYIIIDGKSTDDTLNIINNYRHIVTTLVSEKDRGISDAFNKGIARANGEIIAIINADDYLNPTSIEDVVTAYIKTGKQQGIYYGDIRYFDDDRSYIRIAELDKMWKYMSIYHPSMFVTAGVYKDIGVFSEEYRYVMDGEFVHRALAKNIPFFYINKSLSNFRLGGASDVNFKKMYKEFYKSVGIHRGKTIRTTLLYLWLVFKKNMSQTAVGNFFYKRKHLISFLLNGKIVKG
jgi:glycosyltransferase involved in cell wall biosynthesis